jgi:epoxyqueuosine reductase
VDFEMLAAAVKAWGSELGFQAVGISDVDLSEAEPRFAEWLARGYAGELDYMRKHGAKRTRPAELVPGTLRVISARMDYLPDAADAGAVLADGGKAFIARYALGRDYHKTLRARLQRLAGRIETETGPFGYRVFTDSAGAASTRCCCRARPAPSSSWARSTPTCRCPSTRRRATTAARARAASPPARPGRSSRLTCWTRAAASRI